MLLHPNTGYEYEDHSIWAMWAGQPWPLDMSIFEQGTQTNEVDVINTHSSRLISICAFILASSR